MLHSNVHLPDTATDRGVMETNIPAKVLIGMGPMTWMCRGFNRFQILHPSTSILAHHNNHNH